MIRKDTSQRSKMDYKHRKVPSIFSHNRNENKNYTEAPSHSAQSNYLFKTNKQVDK